MKTMLITLSMLLISVAGKSQDKKKGAEIIVHDKQIHEIIPADAEIEVLGTGFEWTEGPLWLPSEEKLIFSDIPKNSIFEWTEKEGIKLYLKPSGYTGNEKRGGEAGSNGLLLSPEGDLVLCMHGDRRVARMVAPVSNPEPEFETLVGRYNGKKLNSPNDATYNSQGELYFTD
ncbi:MAG: SMP-30/gluconolactonase/LRE family protein, partial [Mariniphaga sp.]